MARKPTKTAIRKPRVSEPTFNLASHGTRDIFPQKVTLVLTGRQLYELIDGEKDLCDFTELDEWHNEIHRLMHN